MSRRHKLIQRLKGKPKDFTWDELETLLKGLGYAEVKRGKGAGSRRRFAHPTAATINLHKPHPGNELKSYQIDMLITILSQEGLI